ncbi:MAG: glycosyl hydrolase family 28-related protein [Armatimonadota bacterium]
MNDERISRRKMIGQIGLLAAGATVIGAVPGDAEPAPVTKSRALNVLDFGAKGDGASDDTSAVQTAIDTMLKAGGGSLYFPAGQYRITRSLKFTSSPRVDIIGDGYSSTILHENDEPCFLWGEGVSCVESSIRDLCISSVKNNKSPDTAAIACLGGSERSFFSNLLINGAGARMGSGIVVDRVMDTTTLNHCLIWGVTGTGVKVARGSEVRIFGARIVGGTNPYESIGAGSTGVHLTGNNGGVHIVTTDIISLNTGLKIGAPGGPSNREIFITHATFDSSIHGIWQIDNAYTSIAGCWAASSDEDQILIDESAHGAILVVSGGTIFNGGAYGRPGGHNGIVVKAGSFVLSGATIRHNQGTGILVGERVRDYAITGCRITNNGTGAVLDGDGYAFTGNIVNGNKVNLVNKGGPNKQVTGNVIPSAPAK